EVEVRPADRIVRREQSEVLVREAGVEDGAVDRDKDLRDRGRLIESPSNERLNELRLARLHHLTEAIEDLPAVERRALLPTAKGVLGGEHGISDVLPR